MWLLDMDSSYYVEEVALIIVFGGTISAAIITYSVPELVKMIRALFRIGKKMPESRTATVHQIIDLAKRAKESPQALYDAMDDSNYNPYFRDGLELIVSGFSRGDLETVMSERLFRDRERDESYGLLLRTISKYPPAFGLVGTVLGLVSVMRAVSTGADAAEIGLQMALALVATFYGLILTNFVLVPMAENLINKAAKNMTHRELMLEGLLLINDKRSPVYVQEVMNSYLSPTQRKDHVGIRGGAAGNRASAA
tara:strand:- start:95475 stop:96233 length:759 start_codon:yes stop_codon:yes gene_type:complete